jgi:hypothetical protein
VSNVLAVHSVWQSLMTYLGNVYPDELKAEFPLRNTPRRAIASATAVKGASFKR